MTRTYTIGDGHVTVHPYPLIKDVLILYIDLSPTLACELE